MQLAGISSYKALSRQAGVSERQVKRLRLGQVSQMRVETLIKLSQALKVSVSELLTTFGDRKPPALGEQINREHELASLQQEYQRLRSLLEQQRETLMQEFQMSSLQVLESFLLYWPTAAAAAQVNPDEKAVKNLLLLVRPVQQLLSQWGVEAIASVGAELPYDPQFHQLIKGTAQPGEIVKVSNLGYRQGEKLLHRVKVSAISKA
ncbi:nucleotide exchange factor GrpE [Coleofasciculus sp. FACHB-SPT9]|nr:nucleotide exchange factor GrpE [Coleofasciculus sp. FACHB-SPT9]MBD1892983.1 nucleotide exchange factor GrpE [Coleofasciculus sp. FACHB-SPT9]